MHGDTPKGQHCYCDEWYSLCFSRGALRIMLAQFILPV